MEIERVLIVDDEDHIRVVARLSAERVGGWHVEEASSGAAAIEMARREPPDVVLLDVMMPELDGPGTLEALRSHSETASVPVIFLTAKVQRHEVEEYMKLGASGVISKPFDPMGLPDEIRKIVGGL